MRILPSVSIGASVHSFLRLQTLHFRGYGSNRSTGLAGASHIIRIHETVSVVRRSRRRRGGSFGSKERLPAADGERSGSISVCAVVTDPQKASVVFTDRIGEGLEQTLDTLSGNRPEKLGDDFRPPVGSLSRGKGAFFLVDLNSHAVLWSTYIDSKDSQPPSLNRLAAKIVEQLQKDRKAK